jgi:hypothetical protein
MVAYLMLAATSFVINLAKHFDPTIQDEIEDNSRPPFEDWFANASVASDCHPDSTNRAMSRSYLPTLREIQQYQRSAIESESEHSHAFCCYFKYRATTGKVVVKIGEAVPPRIVAAAICFGSNNTNPAKPNSMSFKMTVEINCDWMVPICVWIAKIDTFDSANLRCVRSGSTLGAHFRFVQI